MKTLSLPLPADESCARLDVTRLIPATLGGLSPSNRPDQASRVVGLRARRAAVVADMHAHEYSDGQEDVAGPLTNLHSLLSPF